MALSINTRRKIEGGQGEGSAMSRKEQAVEECFDDLRTLALVVSVIFHERYNPSFATRALRDEFDWWWGRREINAWDELRRVDDPDATSKGEALGV